MCNISGDFPGFAANLPQIVAQNAIFPFLWCEEAGKCCIFCRICRLMCPRRSVQPDDRGANRFDARVPGERPRLRGVRTLKTNANAEFGGRRLSTPAAAKHRFARSRNLGRSGGGSRPALPKRLLTSWWHEAFRKSSQPKYRIDFSLCYAFISIILRYY